MDIKTESESENITNLSWVCCSMYDNAKSIKPVLGGVDGSLHLTVPSINRFNQTDPATFSILPC
jgi:hypothetical protein